MAGALLLGALLGWLIHEIAFAPLGYEDALGWHAGPEPVAFFEAQLERGR